MKLLATYSSLLLVSLFAFSGCTEEARRRLEPTPIAVGSLNQLAIIVDDELWEGSLGDSINFYFGSAFPILPQPEPLFDLKHFTVEELSSEPTRRELKAYLVISDLSNTNSPTTEMVIDDLGSEKVRRSKEDKSYNTNVGRDRWAMDQIVIYLFAHGEMTLKEQLVSKFPAIAKTVQNQYQEQLDATTYLGGNNNIVMNRIREKTGYYLKVPVDFEIVVDQEDVLWLKRESDNATSNVLIQVVPYRSQDQFAKENIIRMRDSLGKALISSTIEGSFMRTNPIDLPVFTQSIQMSNAFAVEARGIWEMEGDFLGGPFLSYLVLDEKNGKLIFLDAFVLAPSERKRNYMLYLEHILKSLDLEAGTN